MYLCTHIIYTKTTQRPWRLLWKATAKTFGRCHTIVVEAFWLSLLGKLTNSTGWFSYSIHSHCICNGLYFHYIHVSELKMRERVEILKAIKFQNQHEILISMYFLPKFEFLNSHFAWKRLLKWFLLNSKGFGNLKVLSKSILMSKTFRKKNVKIQISAGNTLKSGLHSWSQEIPPLVMTPWVKYTHSVL